MPEVRISGRILRWGDSYGVRIRKQDLDRAGIQVGENVELRLGTPEENRVDLSGFPLIEDPDPDVSKEHDKHLGEARLKRQGCRTEAVERNP